MVTHPALIIPPGFLASGRIDSDVFLLAAISHGLSPIVFENPERNDATLDPLERLRCGIGLIVVFSIGGKVVS